MESINGDTKHNLYKGRKLVKYITQLCKVKYVYLFISHADAREFASLRIPLRLDRNLRSGTDLVDQGLGRSAFDFFFVLRAFFSVLPSLC